MTKGFINIEKEIEHDFSTLVNTFTDSIDYVPNLDRFFEIEMEYCFSQRYGPDYRYVVKFLGKINLAEYFNLGWQLAESGLASEIPENIYLWGKEALNIFNQEFKTKKERSTLYKRFNECAKEECINGAVHCLYYYWLKDGKEQKSIPLEQNNNPKYTANFYALFHWVQIKRGVEKYFNKNKNGNYSKQEIKNKYPNCSPESFYKAFRRIDITNINNIPKVFGKDYKRILIGISNNDNDIVSHLKNLPN